jgi:hypothetical protein
MFEFFALVIAIVAFIFARKALNQIDALRARLDALEAAAPRVAATPVAPPPVPAYETPIAPLAADEVSTETTEGAAPIPPASPPPASDIPTPAAQPGPGFEERIGTRWVVWVGGLTLALGGFFLVRYSIEQGLLGPGVRVLLGGLFALALLVAGEWTRRKESLAAIEPLPIANIPAILTAAGTAVAFATVYAAYALYDFLVPATAFILLGMVALGTLARRCCTGRRWPASASPPLSRRQSWSPPRSRISGRCIFISPSSPPPPSASRASGCGAGLRSPPSCSRRCGPCPACNADRRWSPRTPSTSSPDLSWRRCWWYADSCSGRLRSRAASSRSRPVRSRPLCLARR